MNGSITIRLPELGITEKQESAVDSLVSEIVVSDQALIAEVCIGGREALAILFRRYARLVRGVALRVLKDPSEADDLVQDVFLLIHRLCRTFDASKASAQLRLSGLIPARRKFLRCSGIAIMTGLFSSLSSANATYAVGVKCMMAG
jgi:hypothetical protein